MKKVENNEEYIRRQKHTTIFYVLNTIIFTLYASTNIKSLNEKIKV